jgi:hypothetical protein
MKIENSNETVVTTIKYNGNWNIQTKPGGGYIWWQDGSRFKSESFGNFVSLDAVKNQCR